MSKSTLTSDEEYFEDIYQNGQFIFSIGITKRIPEEKQKQIVNEILAIINASGGIETIKIS